MPATTPANPPPAAPTGASHTPVLQVQGMGFAYPGQPPLFSGLSFSLPAGLARVDGDSGKTTLLRLLAGELAAGNGRVLLNGQPLDTRTADGRRQVCHLDPRDPAWDAMTPDQVMARARQRHPALDEAAWQRHVAGFDLGPHRGKTLHMLSTGSRRKVTLAVALAAGAALTLLDEPTAGLDQPARAWLAQALTDAAGQPGRAWLLAAAYGLEDALPWAATVTL